jgi:Ca-activated chloride channel family protein
LNASRAWLGARAAALAADVDPSARRRRRRLRGFATLCAAAAFALLVAAELRPRAPAADAATGLDLVLCLDVSRSMLAGDARPTRLAQAQAGIRALAERAVGDRAALVVFAGEARVHVPMTHDRALLAELAADCGPSTLARGGSDLGAALEAAGAALVGAEARNAAIVLFTDGEDLAGRAAAAAAALGASGVAVHCLGFGSERGSKIAVDAARGQAFLRDERGAEVISALDTASLRRIAESSGGNYREVGTDATAVARLYDEVLLPSSRARFARSAAPPGAGLGVALLWLAAGLGILAFAASDARSR